jgi:menaquinone-dependent protoporphyrinogen oxidase
LAGKLNYSLYKTWEKWVIRFIMFLTGGPTHFDAIVDYTPWDRVDDLANQIASLSSAKEAA